MISAIVDLQGIFMMLLALIMKVFSSHIYSKKGLAISCMQRDHILKTLKIDLLYRVRLPRLGQKCLE